MNKKLMTLAVAGAFAAPAAAFAQASNVQIFGTMYLEYAYAKQGRGNCRPHHGGDMVNVDIMQTPGSEIGIKGEEALGGGMSAWFQCTSTADIRGQRHGGFCSRNSAIGVKGSFGNAYAGNWDMPMKRTAGAARIVSDTGIWGVGRMLYGDSSTFNGNATPYVVQPSSERFAVLRHAELQRLPGLCRRQQHDDFDRAEPTRPAPSRAYGAWRNLHQRPVVRHVGV